MSIAASLLRGSILRTFDMFVLLSGTFFVTPLLVHSLGYRLYGFWTLAGAIVGYYGFLDLGLSKAATRYMSQALGKGDADELNRVASTAHFLFSLVALAVMAATALSALACPLFVRDPGEAALFQKLIVILGGAAAIGLPAKVYSGMLLAGIRHDYSASISIARNLIYYAAIYLSLRAGHGIVVVALITFSVSLLQRAAARAACKARFPLLKIAVLSFDRTQILVMLDYGWKILVCHVGDVLRFRVDALVIATFLGASLVTPYAVAVRLVEGFSKLVASFAGTLLPVFSQYQGRGDYDAMRSALLKATKFSAILSAFIGLSVIFYGRAFIRRWMGPGFDDSYGVAAILCGAHVIGLPGSPGINLLYGLSKHKVYAVLSVWEGIVNLLLSVALLRHYGIHGVALGTLFEMAIFKMLIQPFFVCRAVDLSVRTYLLDTILVTLLKTAAPLALYFWLISHLVVPDYAVLAACVAVQTLVFGPAAYFFILNEGERRAVGRAVRGALMRSGRQENLSASQSG